MSVKNAKNKLENIKIFYRLFIILKTEAFFFPYLNILGVLHFYSHNALP